MVESSDVLRENTRCSYRSFMHCENDQIPRPPLRQSQALAARGGNLDQPVARDKWGLIRLDIGLFNNRGERFAFLAREVRKGFAGEAGELDPEGIEALA